MSKAQDVRAKVLAKKLRPSIADEAEKIFDWVLDLIDSSEILQEDRKVTIYMDNDSNAISILYCKDSSYCPDCDIEGEKRNELFKALNNAIDLEEGFTPELHLKSSRSDSIKGKVECILLKVSIN